MHSLPVFLRIEGRPVILIGDGPAADAKRRLLERAGATVVGEDDDARLAIVAVDADHAAEAAVDRLRARGILVNATDRPALCDYTLPAIIDRDPVIIAIGTGGASAGLAKTLRQRIEALLPANLGSLARQFFAARADLRRRWPDAGDRRRAIDAALEGPLSPLEQHGPDAVARWIEADHIIAGARLEVIEIASDDPDLLTLRAARLLGQADTIFHPADMAPAILDRARADADRIVADGVPENPPPGLSLRLTWAERR